MDEEIKRLLGDPAAGVVSSVRAQQLTFARHVADIFVNGGIAMLEAGTGTGKSFGYLTPALLNTDPEFRVVVSTAKKALQSQLYTKDLPHLASKVSNRPYAMLKGKTNYVCQLRLEEYLDTEGVERVGADTLAFVDWAENHPTGDIEMYGSEVDFAHRVRVTECVGSVCPHKTECGYLRAKVDGGRARVLVVNHALLAHDLQFGGGRLLGSYNALVIDEAHQFPSVARDAYTATIAERQAAQIEQAVSGDVRFPAAGQLKEVYRALFNELAHQDLGKVRLIEPTYKALLRVVGVLNELKKQFQGCGVMPQDEDGVSHDMASRLAGATDGRAARARGRLMSVAGVLDRSLKALQRVIEDDDDQSHERVDYLPYLKRGYNNALELAVAPVEIGPLIAPAMVKLNKVVLTSATLATGDSFNFMAREYGLAPKQLRVAARLASPFPRNRSMLYVSKTAPLINHDDKSTYYPALGKEIASLLAASRGGAFVLCASRDDMNGIYETLNRLPGRTYDLDRQTANVTNHVAWFKGAPNRVLIGMKSIWEGVDVPGLGLRLVVIPRIPFPNTKEPLLAARRDRITAEFARQGVEDRLAGIRAFLDFDVQIAAMDIAQGSGRLIRSEGDMGVVAVLDPRMYGANKSYGGILRSTIAKPFTDDPEFVVQFLSKVAERALREFDERPRANP